MAKCGISIVIPCYNAGRFLTEAVVSVLAQPFRYSFEIIIVDDGSSERDTLSVLEAVQRNANVKVLRLSGKRGVQHARNEGVLSARFDYILTLDADDCLNTDPRVLEKGTYTDKAIDILQSSPDVAFVHSFALMFGDYTGLTISAYPVTASLLLEKHHAQTSIVYRREDALNAGLYDESVEKWQDWSFAIGIINARYLSGKKCEISCLQAPYFLYRIHTQTDRISSKQISERDMIAITFSRHPQIFRDHYKDTPDQEIVDIILSKKPDKLKDLLFVASNDLSVALEMVSRRGFTITSSNEPENIP